MSITPSSEEKSRKVKGARIFENAARVISGLFAFGALAGLVVVLNDSGFDNKKALFGFLSVFIGFGSYAAFHRPEEERG